jgi:hypothetical protein
MSFSKVAVISGLHFVPVTCPLGILSPVSLNSKRSRSFEKSSEKSCRQEKINRQKVALTRRFYRPGYVISQGTEAVHGGAMGWNENLVIYSPGIQILDELLCGNRLQLNVFVESLDSVALVLNEIG